MAGGAVSQKPHFNDVHHREGMWPKTFTVAKARNFVGAWKVSAAAYGGVAALSILYFTDWKPVVRYIPFYGGKFKEE